MMPYDKYRQFTPNPEGGARSNATLFDNRQQKNSSDGKFGSFYWLGPLSLVQQNERIFFRVISFILAKYN